MDDLVDLMLRVQQSWAKYGRPVSTLVTEKMASVVEEGMRRYVEARCRLHAENGNQVPDWLRYELVGAYLAGRKSVISESDD